MEPAGAPGPPAVDTPPDGPPPPLESAQGDPPLSKDDQKVQKQAEKDKKKAIAQEEKARKEEEKKLAADKKKADKERKAATKKWEVAKKQAVRCAAGSPAAILSQCLSPTPEAVCARVFASRGNACPCARLRARAWVRVRFGRRKRASRNRL
jgi:hypothetical protein